MNEAETRAAKIAPLRKAAGRGDLEGSRIRREYAIVPGRIEGQGRRGLAGSANNVLIHRNRKLAVIEGEITAWPAPGQLWHGMFREPNAWRHRFPAAAPERKANREARYCQAIAIGRVSEAIAPPLPAPCTSPGFGYS